MLCRYVWHCTPSQLRQERLEDVLAALAIINTEAEVRRLNSLF